MKIRPYASCSRSRWLRHPMNSGAYRHWLIERGSLTKRLQSKTNQFNVRALSVRNGKPQMDELADLALASHQHSLLREVLLVGNALPQVFAHSVLPYKSLRGVWQGLSRLGNQPLGAALFADARVSRAPLEYQKIARHHPLYRQAAQHCAHPPAALWARRSIFYRSAAFKRDAIMVTEVFLPPILDLT